MRSRLRLLPDFRDGFGGGSYPNGITVVVGVIGHEDFVVGSHRLGPSPVSTRSFIQLDGASFRIPLIELRKAFRSSEEIRIASAARIAHA